MKRDLAVIAASISAGVHAALVPEHFHERFAAGAGFVGATVMLGAIVVWLTHGPRNARAVGALALVFAGLIASWALAVTTGVPVLMPEPEKVDGVAVATKLIEAAGLLLALGLVREERNEFVLQLEGARP
jgi:hypothetical protein